MTTDHPCATCGHPDTHSAIVGCLAEDCDCETYARTPDQKAADNLEGRERATHGGQAALHGHALTVTREGKEWRAKAEERLDSLIRTRQEFTADDVTEVTGPAPSPNAIGGLFRGRKKDMTAVGFRESTRPVAHARVLRVWVGK